ncbi:helix-turn-helix domain-containing protein [Chryseobacterium sp. M5A1_1a]
MKQLQPDYKKIYTDMIAKNHPDKLSACSSLLQKDILTILDMLRLNNIIGDSEDHDLSFFNQRYKSYNESTILEILEYQVKNKLNNREVADHFRLSRNTLAKWKKIFPLSNPQSMFK